MTTPDGHSPDTETSPERVYRSIRHHRTHGLRIISPYPHHSHRAGHAHPSRRHPIVPIVPAGVHQNGGLGGMPIPVPGISASSSAGAGSVLLPSFETSLSTYMILLADPRLRRELVAQPGSVLPVGGWQWELR
jgi:hypothetical protein